MDQKNDVVKVESTPPTGIQVVIREFRKDKLALFSFIGITLLIIAILIMSFFMNQDEILRIKLLERFTEPGVNGYILGADEAGRDMYGQLIIGAKNSILIAIAITLIANALGIALGIIMGYYGGFIDNLFMRIIDFLMTLPTLMIIIVLVTIIPKYGVLELILILSAFQWIGTARLVRSKALSEGRRDYVSASKTMGTSDFAIMFKGILPNLSSLLIVELTLNFAGNVGIETGLSFLGFGLPPSTPSLGTLVSYATNPIVLSTKWWIWLPASLLILVLMLGINYVGQALRRAADAKQRLG
ncbi:MAG TPA: ABC transporter permease [Lysinibacillus sp.]|jgi:peptide/nickel transport system permease protein|uniref:ABC transporter permease n=1 Tax=Lysinibacillus fusiformis TaxID=28031 RepID=A0A2I0V4X2_9BACI|nr:MULTISPECIES: ABC transporter permease [Lysinibacillus]HBT71842.1 ABC transporter permease [Lysinibacillus sp.]KUF36397.1 peptide ABC transporter permease [Lysinibacillus sp. F5]MEE3806943.1 ABC transporter permease [Lysinibacillus fusiformis]PKU53340.1 ABC transporter permease [Lysinibacillus fusiformis]SCX81098.1 peptide/nickel transport system permease protein [Lysinibacillus sp. SG9]